MDEVAINYKVIKKTCYIEALVESQTAKGAFYEVKGDDEEWSCTCPDHLNRHATCKHIARVRDAEF